MMRWFFILLGIVSIVGLILGGSYVWDAYVISADDEAEVVSFEVQQGASVDAIAQELEKTGLITSPFLFKVYVSLNDAVLQAGSFELVPGASFSSLVDSLTHAQASEVTLTVPEGFTLAQVGERVVELFDGIDEDEWEAAVGSDAVRSIDAGLILAGIPDGYDLEGYVFPDTYRFRDDASADMIVQTMVLTLKRRLAESGIVVPETLVFENGMTFHEVMTLASIVQREVISEDDMAVVAGIFTTRLTINMALQADSTVNYVTGKKDAAVTYEDSRVQSPYNTYVTLGLPPGPISNPGIQAIEAVLNPEDSDYLYFLTDLEGNVHYATTFDQHVDNKFKYLK